MRRSDNAVIFSGWTDKEKISYCEDCLKVKILSPLRHRIYLDENGKITNPGPDADKWKQCWTCGLIVGVYEAKQEVELDTLTEPRDNPFKFKSGLRVKQENHARLTGQVRHRHKRKLKQDLEQYKEEDVKEALRKGAKLVSYCRKTRLISYSSSDMM